MAPGKFLFIPFNFLCYPPVGNPRVGTTPALLVLRTAWGFGAIRICRETSALLDFLPEPEAVDLTVTKLRTPESR